MNKRKGDFKIILTIKELNNSESKLHLECNKRNIKDTSLYEQLYLDVIEHVVGVVSNQITNDEYFNLEKFIKDDEKLTIKYLLDESK